MLFPNQVNLFQVTLFYPLPEHTHTHRERERQTDRQTDRQTNRQTDRQTDRQTERLEIMEKPKLLT